MITPAEIKRLRESRKVAGVSRRDLATSAGVALDTVHRFENGEVKRASTIFKLLQGYAQLPEILNQDDWIERQVECFLHEEAEELKTTTGQTIRAIRKTNLIGLCRLMLLRVDDKKQATQDYHSYVRGHYNMTKKKDSGIDI